MLLCRPLFSLPSQICKTPQQLLKNCQADNVSFKTSSKMFNNYLPLKQKSCLPHKTHQFQQVNLLTLAFSIMTTSGLPCFLKALISSIKESSSSHAKTWLLTLKLSLYPFFVVHSGIWDLPLPNRADNHHNPHAVSRAWRLREHLKWWHNKEWWLNIFSARVITCQCCWTNHHLQNEAQYGSPPVVGDHHLNLPVDVGV